MMDEENLSNDSSSSASAKNYKDLEDEKKWKQILIALAISYICISGGNLIGYTSSAIPSIRTGNSVPFLRILENEMVMESENNSLMDVTYRIQEIDNILESTGSEKVETTRRNNCNKEFAELTDSQASWIGGLGPLGAFFGSLLAPIPIKIFGPKGAILKFGSYVYVLSWFITALAPNLSYIYFSRFLGGLAMGATFSAVPIYIVETASLKLRGPLGTLSQFLFTIGVLMSFVFGYFLDFRTSALVSCLVVLPNFIILPFIPESPTWLLSKKKIGEAECAFRKIRGFSMESTEFQQLQSHHRHSLDDDVDSASNYSAKQRSSKSLFRSPKEVKSIFVVMFLCIFQQLTGINGVNFYTVTIFEIAAGGNSFLDGHSSAILVALVFCLANVCSYLLIERLGRKFLLILSTTFISLSAFSLGSYFYLLETDYDTSSLSFVPLASLVTFVLAFSIGYGPLLYVIVAEVLSSRVRSVVTPVAVGVNWLCVFLVAKTFPGVLHALKAYGAFWMYGSFSLVSLLFTIVSVPETKGKSEKQIQDFFENKNNSISSTVAV